MIHFNVILPAFSGLPSCHHMTLNIFKYFKTRYALSKSFYSGNVRKSHSAKSGWYSERYLFNGQKIFSWNVEICILIVRNPFDYQRILWCCLSAISDHNNARKPVIPFDCVKVKQSEALCQKVILNYWALFPSNTTIYQLTHSHFTVHNWVNGHTMSLHVSAHRAILRR
jgi:hypothetical protein